MDFLPTLILWSFTALLPLLVSYSGTLTDYSRYIAIRVLVMTTMPNLELKLWVVDQKDSTIEKQ